MERLIFHIDVNSAYLSWEAARQVLQGKPDIRLVPAIIGGSREKRTGVVLAKSIPARQRGIRTGEPVSMALRKCPELLVFPPDFRLYEQGSKAFMDICREYAPVVEKYSIDECFLDMSGTHRLYPDPVAIAHTSKDTIRYRLGFTVNVGIGSNKLLAKMAGDFEKPDKVHTLFSHEIPSKLWPLEIGELFSVGHATAEKLRRAGVKTIGDLAHRELAWVQKLLGVKAGRQLHSYANGIDDTPVRAQPEEAKGYSISTTLEEDVRTREAANAILLTLSDSVAARMRADGSRAECVSVTIRSSDFKNRSHQRTLELPTDITSEIYGVSRELFAELWDGVTPLRLLGISLTGLSSREDAQMTLFPDHDRERSRKLDQAMDAIRSRFGADTITHATTWSSGVRVGNKYRAQMENRPKETDNEE